MKLKLIVSFALAAITIWASETRVNMKDLPAAVQKTVQEQSTTGKLRGLSKEIEKGKTYYEAEMVFNGKNRDLLIDPSGTIVEVEEAIGLESIPAAAQQALKTAAGTGKILSVERVTKGPEVSYEAVIQKGGKKSEVAINADGSPKKD